MRASLDVCAYVEPRRDAWQSDCSYSCLFLVIIRQKILVIRNIGLIIIQQFLVIDNQANVALRSPSLIVP